MANKRYYWLKLQDNFFQSPKIKKLRKIAGGDTYTVIYLKLMLNTIKTEGKFFFEGIEESLEEEIALKLDEDVENVQMALAYLFKHHLIEEISESEFDIPEVQKNIGSETASAQRVRDHRNKQKALHCNGDVTEVKHLCNVEKEIEIDKEIDKDIDKSKQKAKHTHGEFKKVKLTDDELEKLKSDYPNIWEKLIQTLDEYKEMSGKTYKNDYLAIKKWVVDKVSKEMHLDLANFIEETPKQVSKDRAKKTFDNF